MNKILRLLVSWTIFATIAGAAELTLKSQIETWSDETMTSGVVKSLLPAAKDEKAVRAQIAGIMDGFFRTGLLLAPDELRFGKYGDYPACFIRGVSLANFTRRQYAITVVFTTKQTFMIHCFSPESTALPEIENYVRIEGEPSRVTEPAFEYMRPRLKDTLRDMRETARSLATGVGKKG